MKKMILYNQTYEKYKTKRNNYRIKNITYYLKVCEKCGKNYLTHEKNGKYCSGICSNIGRLLSHDIKIKISNTLKGVSHTNETKKKMSIKQSNSNNPNWKGGVKKLNIPLYDTYAHQLEPIELCRKNEQGYLEVKCTYCDRWYVPLSKNVRHRIDVINGKISGELRFYCSKECKSNCSIYRQVKYEKGYRKSSSREVQPELRKLVFERDNWTCIKCGSDTNLHCHHIEGINQNPLESADVDMCITLCKSCHKEVHKQKDCRYSDLRCK